MIRKIELVPLLALLMLVPFIVFSKVIQLNAEFQEVYLNVSILVDTMTYYKSVMTIFLGFVMLMILAFRWMWKDVDFQNGRIRNYLFVLVGMLLCILVSQAVSSHSETALWGLARRYEGTLVWLSYFLSIVYALQVIKEREDYRTLIVGYLLSLILMGVLGLLELMGWRLFEQEWFLKLITPDDISIAYAKQKWVFLTVTLFNSNYMGSYAAMGLIASLGSILWLDRRTRAIASFSGVLMLICLVGSRSSAGFVGAVVGVALVVMLHVMERASRKQVGLVAVILGILFVAVVSMSNGSNMFADELNQLSRVGTSAIGVEYNDIWIKENRFGIKFDKHSFIVEVSNWNVEYYNENNEVILSKRNGNFVCFESPYQDVQLEFVEGSYLVEYTHGEFEFYLNINSDNIQFIDQYGRNFESFDEVSTFGFEGYERLMSNRGYIWSRSLPLLKDRLLIGSGADAYVYHFPQNDIVGKVNTFGNFEMIVDKPHNQYIQMAVNFGMLFVILFVTYIGMLFMNSLKDINSRVRRYQLILVAVIATYLTSAVFNDSHVGVAQVFWVMVAMLSASFTIGE